MICTLQQVDFSHLRQVGFCTSLQQLSSKTSVYQNSVLWMLTFVHFRKGNKSKSESDIRAFKKANTLASLNYYICLLLKLHTHDRSASPLLNDFFFF